MVQFCNTWDEILKGEFEKPYYQALREFLKEEYKNQTIYPPMHAIFNALKTTSYEKVKVVILGQDPYHGPNQAHGMAFSVQPGVAVPPSLKNIYKELHETLGCKIPNNGYLQKWAEQGILLLNTVLTVRAGKPQSHKGKGWEVFTDRVISLLNEREEPVIFLLWGAPAKAKKALITHPRHVVLTAAHPSPLSAHNGFFGCNHFAMVNNYLQKMGKTPIDFQIEDI
ncbi:uracil-DNA glycosylase [Sporanaerobium hydrogeniformans]|uniref:Uracil-DNA glycosylase n=1 Tax=Sporanaerobium hydrogeniformans TaxID=3072179 RepID=A0AC61DJN2_9FIRM|nr:uracil-DNA glycosylase [Sporanaerobium hydrogeniformans]PHV72307.1 uracil-DNA glycosylase [Sporanaerobium hydrogeniformans]